MDRERMDALVTASQGRIRRAWRAMVEHLLEVNPGEQIAEMIRTGHVSGYYPPVVGIADAAKRAAVAWHAAYIAAGQTTARWLDRQLRGEAVAKKVPVFDPSDPPAVRWAAENDMRLIREIEDETKAMIHQVLLGAARTGSNPLEVARELRSSIGLTAKQTQIVENYRRQLESGQFSAALRRELSSGHSDRVIANAMRNQVAMSKAQIDTAVERYRSNWIDMRARTIARTEGLRVAHQGSDELYRQAIARGDVSADQLDQQWHHAGHAATFAGKGKSRGKGSGPRPFHVSMNGQIQPFGTPFVSGLGAELRYPGDPEASAEETANCRCVKTTRVTGGGSGQGVGGPRGGRAAESEVTVADEAALEEEALLAEEEAAAAEQALLEEEFGVTELNEADLLDVEPLDDAALGDTTIPALEEETGFRIGVSSDIAGEAEIDEVDWLADHRATMTRAERAASEAAARELLPASLEPNPYRAPGAEPRVTPSDKPAPVGFSAVDYDGTTYYQQAINGRYYTSSDMALREKPAYAIELGAPNPKLPGYETLEVKTPTMQAGEIRYRSEASGATYTPEMVSSGEAAAQERFLAHEQAATPEKRGLLGRMIDRIWRGNRGR